MWLGRQTKLKTSKRNLSTVASSPSRNRPFAGEECHSKRIVRHIVSLTITNTICPVHGNEGDIVGERSTVVADEIVAVKVARDVRDKGELKIATGDAIPPKETRKQTR